VLGMHEYTATYAVRKRPNFAMLQPHTKQIFLHKNCRHLDRDAYK
jgi:hypothetical protein